MLVDTGQIDRRGVKMIVAIRLKDMCYYEDDFEYDTFYVKKDEKFEENYKKLTELCSTYEDFNEVEEFVKNNFQMVDVETLTIVI